ncbi:MAG: fatty acid desaturase [Actinomycetota bacterium]
MTATTSLPSHDELLERMTGGMAPTGLEPFAGSERLRPDGRPRPEFRAELRRIANVRNVISAVCALALPALLVATVITIDHWLAVLVSIPIMGILQNRLFVLHHEGAHRLLFSNRFWNDLIGVTMFGWVAFGTGSHSYRRSHAKHHRDEFGPREPDFLLYSLYPIPQASIRRKLRRDAAGVSAYRILKPRITGLVKPKYLVNSLRFFAGQLVIFGLFALAGHPLLYLLLWVLPYASIYQVLNRLRAIAEHGGLTRSSDRRITSHHVRQSWLPTIIMVPYGIGWHLAHHVDSGIPFRNLPALTRALEEDGYISAEHTWPSYRALWRALAAG